MAIPVQGQLLPSATRTSTTLAADQTNLAWASLYIVLSVSAASGTGGLQVLIRGRTAGGVYFRINATPAAVTATGTFVYLVAPTAGTGIGLVTQLTTAPLPPVWNVQIAHGDASNYTYSVDFCAMPG